MSSNLVYTYAPWSISKAQCAMLCPAQFKFKYVDKIKELVAPSVNKVGVAAHSVLEQRLLGKSFKEAKEIALEKTPLTTKELESFSVASVPIESFIIRFDSFCKTNGVIKLLIEEKWGVDKDLNPVQFFSKDVFFRGVVDLAVVTKNNDLVVLDHKSGKVQGLEKYTAQLNAYAVLGLATNPNIDGMQGVIHHLQGKNDKSLLWANYLSKEEIKNRVNSWLITYLTSAAESVKDLEVARPKLPFPCNYCSYNISCGAYQELTNK
jgi:hypothetical protein